MLLAIDIGNTSITIGLYKTGTLGPRWRLASDNDRKPDEYGILLVQLIERAGVRTGDVRAIAIASVVPPLTGTIDRACRDYLDSVPLIVDAGTRTGIALRYEDPKQVGSDRVANAAAVRRMFQGPACIVDFGTATIFDAISAEGEYLGGAIAPGRALQAAVLSRSTALLPEVAPRRRRAWGRDTRESIEAGLTWSLRGLVREGIAAVKPRFAYATGGDAAEIADLVDEVVPHLTLEGIALSCLAHGRPL